MLKDLSGYRDKYLKGELNENDLPDNPFDLFSKWFDEIEKFGTEIEPNAMSLSTVSSDFSPLTRIVLLKKFSESGFVFFTNYNSRKGKNFQSQVLFSLLITTVEKVKIFQLIQRYVYRFIGLQWKDKLLFKVKLIKSVNMILWNISILDLKVVE